MISSLLSSLSPPSSTSSQVSQAIQILLQDMKNLKQHILELERYRNQLCQMKEEVETESENVTCYDQDDQCSEEEVACKIWPLI